jgi:hypothetical protein
VKLAVPLRGARLTVLALLALCSLSASASASASAAEHEPRFALPSSNGYKLFVDGHGSTATIGVSRTEPSRHAGSATIYIARGRVSATAIRADFGALGRVSMRFHPSGRITRGQPAPDCPGSGRVTTSFGVFAGTVRFRGEDGYVSVHVQRAKGEVLSPPSLHCPVAAGGAESQRQEPGDRGAGTGRRMGLRANWKEGVGGIFFSAHRAHRTEYEAIDEQTEGRLATYRVAYARAPRASFTSDSALSFGSVRPPAPFSGTGTLRRAANGAKSWGGPLAVSFPGEGDVPLTGTQFKTQLTRGW